MFRRGALTGFQTVALGMIASAFAYRFRAHLLSRLALGRRGVARSALIDAASADEKHGFARKEHGIEDLPGTCTVHDKHVFLIAEEPPTAWPPKWEETSGLPKTLSAALKARKGSLEVRVKLTAASQLAQAGDRPGDVLILPDGIRVRNCTAEHADALVDLVAMASTTGSPISAAQFASAGLETGPADGKTAVFICAHNQRDRRCGVIGPALGEVFSHELVQAGRQEVPVRMCSHVGGHKYAGNVIVFAAGEGHWYGYVDPAAASEIVVGHIVGGKPLIRSKLWRGQAGLSEEEMREKCDGCAQCD
jgi:hypothetical protein